MVEKDYIFDLGEVLLEWNPQAFFSVLFDSAQEADWVFQNIFDEDWRDRSDIYVTVEENVRIQARRHPHYAWVIEKWDSEFFTIMHGLIEENWNAVEALQKNGRRVFALANFAKDKYAQAQERFPALARLDGVLISSEVSFRKPEREIYIKACEKFDLTPEKTIFIDDSMENVSAARNCGMTGYLYTGSRELRSFIQSLEGAIL